MEIEKIKAASVKLFPSSKVALYLPYFEEVFDYAGINTDKRASMFISQIGIECAGFRIFSEDLYYTTASRIVEVWNKRFRMPSVKEQDLEIFADGLGNPYHFLRAPEKLANFAYAARMGNRGRESGDGWRFRGRGPKQVTGAEMYVKFTKAMKSVLGKDYIKKPDDLLIPKDGLYAAGWYWQMKGLNRYADSGDNRRATYLVNGGYNKLKERSLLNEKTLTILS